MSTRRPRVRGWQALVALYAVSVLFSLFRMVQAFNDDRPTRAYVSLGLLMLWLWLGSRAWKGRGADPS